MNFRLEKIADLPFYTEGPAIDSEGNIYCTTLSGKSILKIGLDGVAGDWALCECPNGQIILPGGDHLICDSISGSIRRFAADGRWINNELEHSCADCALHTPNDLVTDNSGNIYFTDSIRLDGRVFFHGIDGVDRVVCANLDYPNGLALSPDQRRLYVAESYKNRILKIDLQQRYSEDITVLADLPAHASGKEQDNLPDGLTTDHLGNIWVAHYGMGCVQVISPEGKLLDSIDTGMPLTSNLIFRNNKELIVTGGYEEPGPGAVLRMIIDN